MNRGQRKSFTGQAVKHYQILERISRGGQGEVYRARDPRLGRDVAIKVSHTVENAKTLSRMQTEGAILARISHPSLAQVYDCGIHQGRPYLVMEFVQGMTLAEYSEGRSFREREIRRILSQLCSALSEVHRQQVLHLDLKPENVLVDERGNCKLIDFGMAWLTSQDCTSSDRPGGTLEYLAPERWDGEGRNCSVATDIFGLGGILFFLLTKRPPLSSSPELMKQRRALEQARTELARIRRSPLLAKVCLRAMAVQPRHRPANALALQRSLSQRHRGGLIISLGLLIAAIFWSSSSVIAHSQLFRGSPSGHVPLPRKPLSLEPLRRHQTVLMMDIQSDPSPRPPFAVMWSSCRGLVPLTGWTPSDKHPPSWLLRIQDNGIRAASENDFFAIATFAHPVEFETLRKIFAESLSTLEHVKRLPATEFRAMLWKTSGLQERLEALNVAHYLHLEPISSSHDTVVYRLIRLPAF